jgi:RNA polymerase sigma-70 factor (ECF subfamily)
MSRTVPKRAVTSHASPDEAAAVLEQLVPVERLRLERIARNRARGLRLIEWQDLLQTAIERVLAGTRPWPRNLPFLTFMAGVMRSIANEYWGRQAREQDTIREADAALSVDDSPNGVLSAAASDDPSPEDAVQAKQELAAVEALFTEDPEAWAIVMASAEGYSPAEIQNEFDMTPTQYDSARKRIRRRVLRKSGEGPDR